MLRGRLLKPYFSILLWTAILFVVCLGADHAWPQTQSAERQFEAAAIEWQQILDQAVKLLSRSTLSDNQRDSLHKRLESVRKGALEARASSATRSSVERELLTALGPPPEEGKAPETPAVEADRRRITESLSVYEGQIKRADLIVARADILLRNLAKKQRATITEEFFKRGLSPLLPHVWTRLPEQLIAAADDLRNNLAVSDLKEDIVRRWQKWGLWFLIALTAALTAGLIFRRWLLIRFGHHPVEGAPPSFRRRLIATAAEGLAKGLLPAVPIFTAAAVILTTMDEKTDVSAPLSLVGELARILIYFFFFTGLVRAALAPQKVCWRIAPIMDASARILALRITALAAVVALERVSAALAACIELPPELTAARSCFGIILFVIILFTLLRRHLWCVAPQVLEGSGPDESQDLESHQTENVPLFKDSFQPRTLLPRIRFAVGFLAAAIVISCLLGYHRLAAHVYGSLITALCLVALLLLVRGMVRETLPLLLKKNTGRIVAIKRSIALSDTGLKIFEHWALIIIDMMFALVAIFLLLSLVALSWDVFGRWVEAISGGFTIGKIKISPIAIATALLVFTAITLVTRYVQRILNDRVLPTLQLDLGLQNSIKTGIGYVGIVIAVLLGISTLGLDLSNLAIIASALSVGIGFGLQNVVSNFVAGLILLIERPVKIGDWVVVGEHQGTIKRINVRATELQTFEHASVIIPNSDMVSKAVINWTHKDRGRRLDIPIGVSYQSDVEKVRQTLLACVSADERIALSPEASVLLKNFGDSAIEFELRCFIPDVDNFIDVSTDLRFAIWHAFNEERIEIPFPQRVVHIPATHGLQPPLGTASSEQTATDAPLNAPDKQTPAQEK
jgi:small-conductance mechanosensitive channel